MLSGSAIVTIPFTPLARGSAVKWGTKKMVTKLKNNGCELSGNDQNEPR